jgi:hypothetical protein
VEGEHGVMSDMRTKLIESGWWDTADARDPGADPAAFLDLKQRICAEGREDEYLRVLYRILQISPIDELGSVKLTSVKKIFFKAELVQLCEAVLKLRKLSIRVKPAK